MVPPKQRLFLLVQDTELSASLKQALGSLFELHSGWRYPDDLWCDLILAEGEAEDAERVLNLPERPPVLLLADQPSSLRGGDDYLPREGRSEQLLHRVHLALSLAAREGESAKLRDECRRLQEQLRVSAEELELTVQELERQRTDMANFLRGAVHDLRNPLNGIIGFGKILQRKAASRLDEKQRGNLLNILEASRQLGAMIDDLATAHHTTGRRSLLTLEAIETEEFLRELLRGFEGAAEAGGNRLASTCSAAFLRTDPRRLHFLLDAMLGRVLEGARGEVITVSVHPDDEAVEVLVCKSEQAPPMLPIDQPSTPLWRLAGRQAQILGARLEVSQDESAYRLLLARSSLMVPVSFPPLGEGPDILVVDDEVSVLESLRSLLSDSGFRVHVANLAEFGLEIAGEVHPKVIITDLNMPTMDGLEMVAKLKEDPDTAEIPVIIWSGTEGRREHEQVAAWLTKPFDLDHVMATVRQLLDSET